MQILTLRELVKIYLNEELPPKYSTNLREIYIKAIEMVANIERIPNSYKFIHYGKKELKNK